MPRPNPLTGEGAPAPLLAPAPAPAHRAGLVDMGPDLPAAPLPQTPPAWGVSDRRPPPPFWHPPESLPTAAGLGEDEL